ncbi:hypothetical protein [Erwinia sp. E_sp_B04_7]|uniref:hypothetical protein n=1 Tax=unclassified Erwinia TaxID=2622719 RepID=UPI0030D4B83D
MKEITVIEMNDVSGAYGWDFSSIGGFFGSLAGNTVEAVASITLAASVGTAAGALIAGKHGGDGGGLLGFGSIGQGVGMISGAIIGGLTYGIAGAVLGWDVTLEYSKKATAGIIEGTLS